MPVKIVGPDSIETRITRVSSLHDLKYFRFFFSIMTALGCVLLLAHLSPTSVDGAFPYCVTCMTARREAGSFLLFSLPFWFKRLCVMTGPVDCCLLYCLAVGYLGRRSFSSLLLTNPDLSKNLSSGPGVGQTIALHASHTARNLCISNLFSAQVHSTWVLLLLFFSKIS